MTGEELKRKRFSTSPWAGIILSLFYALAAHPLFGFVEELYLDVWAKGQTLPRGWTHNSLEKGDGGAYFNAVGDWLKSPVFDAPIRTVAIEVRTSSADLKRELWLYPVIRGVSSEEGLAVQPSYKDGKDGDYATQEFSLEGKGADQFELKIVSSQGANGNWWIRRIVVHFGDASTDPEGDLPPRCWNLSEFVPKPGFRMADLASLQNAKTDTENIWRNGISVDGFHAFSESGACVNIRVGNSSSIYSGLYVIDTNEENGPPRALSLLGTSGSAIELLLPIALDTVRPLAKLSVGYRVWELVSSGRDSVLSFSYRTLDDLATMSASDAVWTSVPDADWRTGKDDCGLSRSIEFPVKNLRGAKYVCLRWSVPKKSSSSIIGITDICVAGADIPSGFLLSIR